MMHACRRSLLIGLFLGATSTVAQEPSQVEPEAPAQVLLVRGRKATIITLGVQSVSTNIGGIGFVTYEVEEVLHGKYAGRTINIAYFTNSVSVCGLPDKAVLILAPSFFPYPKTQIPDQYWALGGDAYRGIIASSAVTPGGLDVLVRSNPLANPCRHWLSEGKAKKIAAEHPVTKDHRHQRIPKVVATRRYPYGWVVEVRPAEPRASDYWIVLVGDDGHVKDVIGGM